MKIVKDVFEGSDVRIIMRDGMKWMPATDVAKSLGYSDPSRAVRDFYSRNGNDFKGGVSMAHPLMTRGGKQNVMCLSLEGVILFTMQSNMPNAKPFQKWATGVLAREITSMADSIEEFVGKTKKIRNGFTETLQTHGVNKAWQFGKITKDMKPPLGIDREKSKKDYDFVELSKTMASEALAAVNIIQNKATGYLQCHGHSVVASKVIGDATRMELA